MAKPLYRAHELAFRTQYAELMNAFAAAPKSMLAPIKPLLKLLVSKAEAHPAMVDLLRQSM